MPALAGPLAQRPSPADVPQLLHRPCFHMHVTVTSLVQVAQHHMQFVFPLHFALTLTHADPSLPVVARLRCHFSCPVGKCDAQGRCTDCLPATGGFVQGPSSAKPGFLTFLHLALDAINGSHACCHPPIALPPLQGWMPPQAHACPALTTPACAAPPTTAAARSATLRMA